MLPVIKEEHIYSQGKRVEITRDKEALLNWLRHLSVGDRLLDIGCGTGEIADKCQHLGYKVTALDFSSKALNVVRENYGDVETIQHNLDSSDIPVADGSFGVVVASAVIEHLFDPLHVLGDIYRVLRKDGVLLVTIPNDAYLSNRIKISCGLSYQQKTYQDKGYYKHHTFFNARLFEWMAQKSGFEVKERMNTCRIPLTSRIFKMGGGNGIQDLFAIMLIYKLKKNGG